MNTQIAPKLQVSSRMSFVEESCYFGRGRGSLFLRLVARYDVCSGACSRDVEDLSHEQKLISIATPRRSQTDPKH
eukprot:2073078-Amphidinium_carterae.1